MTAAATFRVCQDALESALQLLAVWPDRHAASLTVGKRDDTVYVLRHGQVRASLRDQLRSMRGTIAGRDNRDVVARSHSAVFALKSKKGFRRGGPKGRRSPSRDVRYEGRAQRMPGYAYARGLPLQFHRLRTR